MKKNIIDFYIKFFAVCYFVDVGYCKKIVRGQNVGWFGKKTKLKKKCFFELKEL